MKMLMLMMALMTACGGCGLVVAAAAVVVLSTGFFMGSTALASHRRSAHSSCKAEYDKKLVHLQALSCY